jgi:hypothetical protein
LGGPAAGEIWEDKRAEGEPLWPDRFPAEVLHERQKNMTSHTVAGHYQQRPTAREAVCSNASGSPIRSGTSHTV